MKVDCAVARNHRDPWSKRRPIAQCVQLLERMKKDVLNQIVDFSARNTSEKDAVDEWRVKTVKPPESVAVAFERRGDQHGFDSRLIHLLGCGGCRRSHSAHVRCGGRVVR